MELFCCALLLLTLANAIPQIDQHPLINDEYDYFALQLHDPAEKVLWQHTSSAQWYSFGWQPALTDKTTHLQRFFHEKANKVVRDELQFDIVGQIGTLTGHYLARKQKPVAGGAEAHLTALEDHPDVRWALHQKPKKLYKRSLSFDDANRIARDQLQIKDPGFSKQFYLIKADRNADINVTSLWAVNITGKGVVTALIDDGLDYNHPDLRDNFFLEGSYDFNTQQKHPLPILEDDTHGTRCAGEIAASINSVCGVGVAYGAKVAGIRLLGGTITDVDEALALNYAYQLNHIYSCSWGPSDDGRHVEGPNQLVQNAIINGVTKGRNGLGSIFVFATGNGGINRDNCNYDGYTNSIYGISIGAIDYKNRHPEYSEMCSAHLAVTYSSPNDEQEGNSIFTTDVMNSPSTSDGHCNANHGGTSAAAPLAVGIFALVLQVRPDLSYRDMQHLAIRGAVPVSLDDPDWDTTYAGRKYSHKFGYGKLDAYQIVQQARNWTKVKRQVKYQSPLISAQRDIPFGPMGIQFIHTVTDGMIKESGVKRIEHVTVTVNIAHARRGDLDIYLISPHGIVSNIGPHRGMDLSTAGYKNWTFSSVKHWEEDPVGDWTLKINDIFNPTQSGTLTSWQLTIYGESSRDSDPISILSSSDPFMDAFTVLCFVGFISAVIYGGIRAIKRKQLGRPLTLSDSHYSVQVMSTENDDGFELSPLTTDFHDVQLKQVSVDPRRDQDILLSTSNYGNQSPSPTALDMAAIYRLDDSQPNSPENNV